MINFRNEEIKFMPEIEKIIKDNFRLFPQDVISVNLSTTEEDTKESFDLVYKSKVEVSVRIREYSYLKQFGDFTIRSRSYCCNQTEIDKLIAGKGSIYLYAWKSITGMALEAWILVDINKCRKMFTEINVADQYNYDGTAFKSYNYNMIKEYDAIINYYNIDCIIKKIDETIRNYPNGFKKNYFLI